MRARCRLLMLAAVWAMSGSTQSWATGELHLSFYMRDSASGSGFVGGTLVNASDEPVAHGYVVVTLLDAQCRLLRNVMESFDSIAAGQKRGFRIAVGGDLRRYRLLSVKGFNSEDVAAVDDKQAILKACEAEDRTCCAQA